MLSPKLSAVADLSRCSLRVTHKQRIKAGIRFCVVVGSHKVAEGVVTEVLHLVDEN